jgi:hypothetical protein
MERLDMDTIGPLEEDENGNKYILVIIDAFSRFVEFYPSPDVDSASAVNALMQHIGRYGLPKSIMTDRGTQFISNAMTELTTTLGISHTITISHSKEENGIVERANKEILKYLQQIIFTHRSRNKWSSFLPLVQRIMNSTMHGSLGTSPARIMFGPAMDLDRGLIPQIQNAHPLQAESLEKFLKISREEQLSLIESTRQYLQMHEAEFAALSTDPVIFPINSLVLVRYPRSRMDMAAPTKLHLRWRGPMLVISRDISKPNHYVLQNFITKKEQVFHAANMKPFRYNEAIGDPKVIAYSDEDEFEIEQVLKHKWQKGNRSTLEFLIKFTGYDKPEWTHWNNLKSVELVHDYMMTHKLRSFIPKSYRKKSD